MEWTAPGLHPITKTSAGHWDLCPPGTFVLVSSTVLPQTFHMHRKKEKAQAWQKMELDRVFFLLMKQQNDLVLPEVMIAVSQKSNWCQKVNHQTLCTLASHTLKIQLCVLVHAPHIAIATVKPINLM